MGTTVGDTVGANVGALLGIGVGTEIVLVNVMVYMVETSAVALSATELFDVTAVTVVPVATTVEFPVTVAPTEIPVVEVTDTEEEPATVVPVTFTIVTTGVVYVGLRVGKGVGAVGSRVGIAVGAGGISVDGFAVG